MKYLFIALILLVPCVVSAKEAAPVAENPEIEKRVMSLAQELRCLVCQNESLAESHADLAGDLRREMRTQMKSGKSDEEVLDFMVQRYGDFIRFRPAMKSTTALLWFGPIILLLSGIAALIFYLKRRQRRVADISISDEEIERIKALLHEEK